MGGIVDFNMIDTVGNGINLKGLKFMLGDPFDYGRPFGLENNFLDQDMNRPVSYLGNFRSTAKLITALGALTSVGLHGPSFDKFINEKPFSRRDFIKIAGASTLFALSMNSYPKIDVMNLEAYEQNPTARLNLQKWSAQIEIILKNFDWWVNGRTAIIAEKLIPLGHKPAMLMGSHTSCNPNR